MWLGARPTDVAREGWAASSFLLCKAYVWFFFSVIHYCIVLFRLIFMLKTQKFIYVSWLKYSFLTQTNGDKLYMFLFLKVNLAQKTNIVLSDQVGIRARVYSLVFLCANICLTVCKCSHAY